MRRTLRRCVAVPPAGYHSRPGYLQYNLRRGMAHPPAAIRAGDADDPSALALQQAEPVRAALTTFADEEEHAAGFDAVVPVGQTSVEEFPRPVSDARRHLGDDDDDDVFVEDPEMDSRLQKDSAGTTCAVPKDAMDIVTDEFAKIREREKERRRRILNELANPDPMDYRYDGKLVPVPPINFGQLSPEAYNLGQSMFVGHNYSLVRQAKQSDYFFEINDLYVEIVFVGRANAGKSSLINALSQQGMAKTSSLPNSTRTANFYQSTTPEELSRFAGRNPSKLVKLPAGGLQFTLVDLPGFGIEGMSDKWRDNAIAVTDAYLGVRRSVNTVFMCIDADRGLTPTDLKYFDWLANVQGVFWILITQCDKVPHSRVCNVMSQVYKALTENRKKYRKAYPFVLPVSAHTGANIDTLRALIVETSGVIPGSKLRDILRRRSHEALQRLAEEERLRKANINHLPALEAGDVAEAESMLPVEEGPPSPPPEPAPRRTVELHLPAGESNIIRTNDLKLNLGLQRRDVLELDLDDTPHPPPASVAMAGPGTSDLSQPTGVVSDFLEEVAAQETAADEIPRHRHNAERQVISASKAKGPRVAVEQPDGRFEETVGGHRIPGHTVRVGEMKNRRNAWKARQKLTDAQRAAPSAPWSQPTTPLSKSESKAYHRNNGRVMSMSDFEDFSSVTQSDNETRLTPTEFSKRQLEHNHSTRVSGGALPQGLLKKYGSQKPTPSRVLGL